MSDSKYYDEEIQQHDDDCKVVYHSELCKAQQLQESVQSDLFMDGTSVYLNNLT